MTDIKKNPCVDAFDFIRLNNEIAILRGAIGSIIDAYDKEVFMRTADGHSNECKCLRCIVDNARSLLE